MNSQILECPDLIETVTLGVFLRLKYCNLLSPLNQALAHFPLGAVCVGRSEHSKCTQVQLEMLLQIFAKQLVCSIFLYIMWSSVVFSRCFFKVYSTFCQQLFLVYFWDNYHHFELMPIFHLFHINCYLHSLEQNRIFFLWTNLLSRGLRWYTFVDLDFHMCERKPNQVYHSVVSDQSKLTKALKTSLLTHESCPVQLFHFSPIIQSYSKWPPLYSHILIWYMYCITGFINIYYNYYNLIISKFESVFRGNYIFKTIWGNHFSQNCSKNNSPHFFFLCLHNPL